MNTGQATPECRRHRFGRAAAEVYEPLQRYARRRSTPEIADDVVADTLLVLWRRLDEVVDGDELAWCYGVARRVLANHRRSETRRRRLIDRLTSTTASASASAAPRASEPDHPEVRRALAELATADREVLMLWAWEGLQPNEMATVLGISSNAATIRLHRAKRRLRRRLERRQTAASAGQSPFGLREDR